ncbi:hypothetical protein BDW42DRAFT_187228 [Aspergillus taichungensis]|uniref:Uncharacterized protein n=1 Tax=Aspergillus taichungensis TaxID=482145 RepID=A0A2J5HNA7_9EURO|nr:hypothetical protein BDW42DRAFT_187228 [Aspergillus taichungensis]
MDVVACAQAAAALAGMFLEIVRTMKHVIETMKGARLALLEMLTHAYRQTANEVLELVRKVAGLARRHDLLMKVNWFFYRSDVVALGKKLGEREKDLGLVLTFIAAYVLNYPFGLESPPQYFELVTPFGKFFCTMVAPPQASPSLWLGVLVRDSFTPVYLEKRDKLAFAAKHGCWPAVLEILDEGRRVFDESWPNAVRLRTLAIGQTKGEFRCADITAAEIARELGYNDIYSILAPVIRHVLPAATLTLLQTKFDEFLQAELEECVTLTRGEMRLPPLAALTELERPEMWFPLALFQKAFLFRLDGGELVVLSLGRRQPPSRQAFRITTTGWTAIQDVIITG